jgi:hypothetical protein
MQRKLRSYLLAVLAAGVFPAVAVAQGQSPSVSFSFSPESPRTGDQVRFESSSCDPDGQLVRQDWDLDGDGLFDDAEGSSASTTFAAAGSHLVGLQVTTADGATAVRQRTVGVNTAYALPQPDTARLMSPFPVVTLAGRLTRRGAQIRLLTVRAPVCALVKARCRGRGCPRKRVSVYAGRKRLRIRRFERRLRAGAVITVRVSKGQLIGKITTFRIRRRLEPKRSDLCLKPGATTGSRCPRD